MRDATIVGPRICRPQEDVRAPDTIAPWSRGGRDERGEGGACAHVHRRPQGDGETVD
jgi:hypothetical protein